MAKHAKPMVLCFELHLPLISGENQQRLRTLSSRRLLVIMWQEQPATTGTPAAGTMFEQHWLLMSYIFASLTVADDVFVFVGSQ